MTLTEMIAALKIELSDASWDSDELTRAVTEAVADVSRFFPDDKTYEFTITLDVDDESWTSAGAHGTYTALANKPIDYGSEKVTNVDGTTTYTRDTDYTMDYRSGKITTIDGGSMAISTGYVISYTIDKQTLDISSIGDLIRILKVEYPIGETPMKFIPFSTWGTILHLNLYAEEGNYTTLSEGKHLLVYYQGECTAPAASTDGSFPRILDEVVLKGASAYALMNRGIKELHDALTAADAASSNLGSIAVTETETALDKVTTYIGKVDTALGKITSEATAIGTAITNAAAYIIDANDALDKVATEIEQAGSGTDEDLEDVSTLLDDANTALDSVATQIASMATALGEIAAIWTDEGTYRTLAAGYLTSGDDYINSVNVGDRVAELYNLYAQTEVAISRLSESVRTTKLAEAETYLASAAQFSQEATGRLITVDGHIKLAQERVNQARAYMDEGSGRLGIVDRYLNEANIRLGLINSYIQEAGACIGSTNGYIAEAQARLATEELLRHAAETYVNVTIQQQSISERYLKEAIERRNEFWSILKDKTQYRDEYSIVSQRQPA